MNELTAVTAMLTKALGALEATGDLPELLARISQLALDCAKSGFNENKTCGGLSLIALMLTATATALKNEPRQTWEAQRSEIMRTFHAISSEILNAMKQAEKHA